MIAEKATDNRAHFTAVNVARRMCVAAIIMRLMQFYHLYTIMRARALAHARANRFSRIARSLYHPLYLHINELFRGYTTLRLLLGR